MDSNETNAGVQEFFASYRIAFERYDSDAIVDHFIFPSHVVSDAEEVALMPFATKQDCRVGVERVLGWHRELGVGSGRVVDYHVSELSPRLANLHLRFELCDHAQRPLYDFEGFYTLVRTQGSWRIAAIAHNQIPRLLACLAEHRPNIEKN